jgi:hypothetical protein
MPCERLHDEDIEAQFVPLPNGLEKRGVFLLANFWVPAEKNENLKKARPRRLVAALSCLARNAQGGGRQTGRRALSDPGQDTGNAPRQ